jgi:hypothetical protein
VISQRSVALELKKSHRDFAGRFARAIIAKDYAAAHRMLAPWLQRSLTPARLAEVIEAEVKEIADINEIGADVHPKTYQIDSNICTLEDLKGFRSYAEDRIIAPEVTDENFRKWMVIQFQPSEDEELDVDAYLDWWMILVEQDGEYSIGYFEIEDPD